MEANVIKAAREVFDSQESITKKFDMTSAIVDSTDMICGMRLTCTGNVSLNPCISPDIIVVFGEGKVRYFHRFF